MSQKSIYFISDAHLGISCPGYDDREKHLVGFLRSITHSASHLFILGDLFDFWIEYRHAVRPDYFPMLHCLRSMADAGVAITYLGGNHDFALGPFLGRYCGVQIALDSLNVTLQGKKFFLHHGDGQISTDKTYHILKMLLRNRLNQALYRFVFPPDIGVPLGRFFSGASRHWHHRHVDPNRLAFYRASADRYLDRGADYVIFGHTHHAEISHRASGIYCNTGEWIRQYTYAKLEAGRLSLWRYHAKGTSEAIPYIAANSGDSMSHDSSKD